MTGSEVLLLYEAHGEMLYRTCCLYVKNRQDAQDAVQNTLLKLMERKEPFDSPEHAKNWIMKVGINECRKITSHWWRKKRSDLEDFSFIPDESSRNPAESYEILDAVMQLPVFSRIAIYLYYYEGYTTEEISKTIGRNAVTVRSDLLRGRKRLKLSLTNGEEERRDPA